MSFFRDQLSALLFLGSFSLGGQALQEPLVAPEFEEPALVAKVAQTTVFGVSPLTGFVLEEWVGQPNTPVMRKIGSGSPELLIYLAGGRPTMAQTEWMKSVGDELEAKLASTGGTIHLLVDGGPGAAVDGRQFGTFPLGKYGGLIRSSEGVLSNPSSRFLVDYFLAHPKITAARGMAFPKINDLVVAERGTLRAAHGVGKEGGTFKEFLSLGLGIPDRTALLAEGRDDSWYRLEGEPDWLNGHPDPEFGSKVEEPSLTGEVPLDPTSDWERRHQGEKLEFCASTKSPTTVASDLLSKLEMESRLGIGAPLAVEAMGGNLWQVELTLRAPELQITPADPNRTYPRDSFQVNLDWGPATSVDGSEELPTLAYLAWRSMGSDHFELLQSHSGRFRFPNGDIPKDVSLRLVIQADGGAGRLMGLALKSRLYGTARAEFVANAIGEVEPKDSVGDSPL